MRAAGLARVLLKAIQRRRGRLRSLNARPIAVRLGSTVAPLAWRVSTTILAKVDLELAILFPVAHALDRLDGVGDVGEVDKRTAFLTQGVDQLDLTVFGKVLAQTVLGPRVVEIADVYVARGTTTHRQGNGWREGARMLPPADLQPTVVDHQALQIAQGVERCGRGRVNKGHEADVLVGDVANVVQQTPADHITDLLDGGLGVDVAEIDGAVAQVVHASSGGGHGGRGHGLLGECVGDQVSIGGVEDVRISRRNPQKLGGVLLLRLGDVGAAILTVEDPLGDLPLGFLRQLGDCLHGVANG